MDPPISVSTPNVGRKGVVLDRGLCVFALEVCFLLISPAYKYLPTLVEMVSIKLLPLG